MVAVAAILKFFKRHLLANGRSDWAKTLWEASERHRDSELLTLFRSDLRDGRHAAILKFFKWYLLPSHKLGWAETWWEALERHRDSELLKLAAILKILKPYLLLESDWAQTWWKALGPHGDLELLKSFSSSIQDINTYLLFTLVCSYDVEKDRNLILASPWHLQK